MLPRLGARIPLRSAIFHPRGLHAFTRPRHTTVRGPFVSARRGLFTGSPFSSPGERLARSALIASGSLLFVYYCGKYVLILVCGLAAVYLFKHRIWARLERNLGHRDPTHTPRTAQAFEESMNVFDRSMWRLFTESGSSFTQTWGLGHRVVQHLRPSIEAHPRLVDMVGGNVQLAVPHGTTLKRTDRRTTLEAVAHVQGSAGHGRIVILCDLFPEQKESLEAAMHAIDHGGLAVESITFISSDGVHIPLNREYDDDGVVTVEAEVVDDEK